MNQSDLIEHEIAVQNNEFDTIDQTAIESPKKILVQKNNFNNKVSPLNDAKGPRENGFVVAWKNISYTINFSRFMNLIDQKMFPSNKVILNDITGHFKRGELTALMGPSGAGKSTLLECICGLKQKGVDGQIKLIGSDKVKIGIVPQHDCLHEKLTVFEAIMFSYKLKYGPEYDSNASAEKLIKQFQLETCINNRAEKCSGGQRKRLSIALELLTKPDILILDEPTSGLDSMSCAHVIRLMLEQTQGSNPIAVLATIHQPSNYVFNYFHLVHILTVNGECIYSGHPMDLLPTLSKFGLKCPEDSSPQDFIIDVSLGYYGQDASRKLIEHQKSEQIKYVPTEKDKSLLESVEKEKHPLLYHTSILFHRSILTQYRNWTLIVIRYSSAILIALILSLLFGPHVGEASACPPTKEFLYTKTLGYYTKKLEDDTLKVMVNVGMVFIGIMIGLFNSLGPTVLTFPMDMLCFIKEYHNNWYSCLSYYLAKSITDLPIQITVPVIYQLIIYHMTGQPKDYSRQGYLFMIAVLMSLVGQSFGQMVSAIYAHNVVAAAFAGAILPMPQLMFGGFLVKVSRMPAYFRPLSYLTFMRFTFEAILINFYGRGRCQNELNELVEGFKRNNVTMKPPSWFKMLPVFFKIIDNVKKNNTATSDEDYDYNSDPYSVNGPDANDEAVKKLGKLFYGSISNIEYDPNRALILAYYELDDDIFYKDLLVILVWLIFYQILTYFVLRWKLSTKNK